MIDWETAPAEMPTADIRGSLGSIVTGLHRALGRSTGRLDKTVRLSSSGAAVQLGFLGLALELRADEAVTTPFDAVAIASWAFGPDSLTVQVYGDIAPRQGGIHQGFGFNTSIEAANLAPGLVGSHAVRSADVVPYLSRRKGKTRWGQVSLSIRLWLLEEARPIGVTPQVVNSRFIGVRA